ncbi:MAG TPA: glycosyltransferase family 9 protein [Stellaceae bacterium]|nr:glycosyltransferase family 9 protein [Stellaceae bacterium]
MTVSSPEKPRPEKARRRPRRWFLFYPLDLLARFWPVFGKPRGVLVVRIDGIGDMVLFHPAFAHYAQALGVAPSEITILGCQSWAALAPKFFPGIKFHAIDEHAYDRSLLYRFKISLWLRRQNFAIATLDSFMRKPLVADSLIYVSGAPTRIVAKPYLSPKTQRLFDWYLARCRRVIDTGPHPTHEIPRHFTFVSALAGRSIAPEPPRLPWRENVPATKQPYAIINFGANEPGRRWAFENFLAVAAELKKRGLTVVFVGGPAEAAYKNCLAGEGFVDLIGATTLDELLDLLRHAALVITNETGPAHLAIGLGAPTVTILGGGQFNGWMPFPSETAPPKERVVYRRMPCYGCLWNCTQPHRRGEAYPCVAAVEIAEVLSAARDLMPEVAAI